MANAFETWTAISAASRRDDRARVPFAMGGKVVGSVARAHLSELRGMDETVRVADDLVAFDAIEDGCNDRLAGINAALRERGLIRAWRNELFPVVDPLSLQPLARFERAASRFWGTLTFGAHATGYVADALGRPTHIWIAQRAFDKPTDPGLFDNLIGGGVPAGQSPLETLQREGWEEAGLDTPTMQRAQAARTIRLHRDIPEGLQHEWLYAFDLGMQPGETPANQDGEVAGFSLLPVAEALEIAAGDGMTVDASVVTLDFALRHRLLDEGIHARLAAAAAGLWVEQRPQP